MSEYWCENGCDEDISNLKAERDRLRAQLKVCREAFKTISGLYAEGDAMDCLICARDLAKSALSQLEGEK